MRNTIFDSLSLGREQANAMILYSLPHRVVGNTHTSVFGLPCQAIVAEKPKSTQYGVLCHAAAAQNAITSLFRIPCHDQHVNQRNISDRKPLIRQILRHNPWKSVAENAEKSRLRIACQTAWQRIRIQPSQTILCHAHRKRRRRPARNTRQIAVSAMIRWTFIRMILASDRVISPCSNISRMVSSSIRRALARTALNPAGSAEEPLIGIPLPSI